MILLLLTLLLLAAFMAGAGCALWWVSPQVADRRQIDDLARRVRR